MDFINVPLPETVTPKRLIIASIRDLLIECSHCRSSRSRVKEYKGMLLLSSMQFLSPTYSSWDVVGFLADGVSVDTLNAELEALADAAGWPKPIDPA